jgi:AraC-like DNA-binding protein
MPTGEAHIVQRPAFTSDTLPAELDDRARFQRWTELHSDLYCTFDHSRIDDHPFSAHFQFSRFGGVKTSQFTGTVNGLARTRQHLAKDTNDDFGIVFNRSRGAMQFTQTVHRTVIEPGAAIFFTGGEALNIDGRIDINRTTLAVPREPLLELVPSADDLLLDQLDLTEPALQHLSRYLGIILQPDADGETLAEHIDRTTIDLVALVLGAIGDSAGLARSRGLRVARVREILAEIKKGFSDGAFSSRVVGSKIGLSARYVQELLQETTFTFSERVLELRLQKARAMLGDPRCRRLKISDIALASGFNEVSYFNRCFRRRFGASPTQYRA